MDTRTLHIPVLWPGGYFAECDSCLERLKQMLENVKGVSAVAIHPENGSIDITYDTGLITFDEIRERARLLGVDIAERYRHHSLRITTMDCPDCALKIENAVRKLPGVAWASLNYATGRLALEFDPEVVSIDRVRNRIQSMGYGVEPDQVSPLRSEPGMTVRNLRVYLTALSGLLMAAGALAALLRQEQLSAWLYVASAVSGGVFAARAGILGLLNLSLDMNFLMTAAAVGAIALGEYWEAAAVMFLFSLGSTLEAVSVEKARRSIRSLLESFPSSALVKRGSAVVQLPLEEISVGEVVIIKPGDRIPVDGTVLAGVSSVDESAVTGEPTPRDKACGDQVYAGSVNGRGALEVRVSRSAEDNTVARIVHMVEEAQAQKAPSQRFSEAFGKIYTPAVIALAGVLAVFGAPVFGGLYAEWVKKSLTLLVVSCPCALVISTPVAIVSAIAGAARCGVLIKGGVHLENLGEVTVAVFDKTGTLTTGSLSVKAIIPAGSKTPSDVLRAAASVESRSEHPLADAILDAADEAAVEIGDVTYFEAFPGKGARALVDGELIYAGSARLAEERGVDVNIIREGLEPYLAVGCTVVYVWGEQGLIGAVAAADTIKPGAAPAISALRREGIRKTVLLTGDSSQAGDSTARELGIDEAYCELLPEDKLTLVRELGRGKDGRGREKVVMVGDGINDAPALAAADVGVAMGGIGTPAAIEAADVALMGDDIVTLPHAVSLGRRTRRIIRQNVSFAVTVAALLVAGALMQKVNLASGVLGHEGSALLVIANSMRLLTAGNRKGIQYSGV